MKTRVVVCLAVMISLFLLGMLPTVAQEDACYAKNGNWLSDTQKCVLSAGVHVDVDYPLEMAQYPEAAKVIDAFILDEQKNLYCFVYTRLQLAIVRQRLDDEYQ